MKQYQGDSHFTVNVVDTFLGKTYKRQAKERAHSPEPDQSD